MTHAPIITPLVFNIMSSISVCLSGHSSWDSSIKIIKQIPANTVFLILSSLRKQIGHTIPTGINIAMFPIILISHPSYLSKRKKNGIKLIMLDGVSENPIVSVPIFPSTKCNGKYTNLAITTRHMYTRSILSSRFTENFLNLIAIMNRTIIQMRVIKKTSVDRKSQS